MLLTWEYKNDTDTVAARNHYKTLSEEELINLRVNGRTVSELAFEECALFLWTTVPMLDQAMRLVKNWGFSYKSCYVWDKTIEGNGRFRGHYSRVLHEMLLLALKGGLGVPRCAPKDLHPSVYTEESREHSRKPEYYYSLIEGMYPGFERIELFARNCRLGWDAWGNQVPKH